jgi:hypothetical protein
MGSVCDGLVKLGVLRGAKLAQGLALQLQPVCAVDEAIEYGVGNGGIADVSVPIVDRQLGGDDGRSTAVSIIGDLQQIAPLLCGERCQSPVIEDQNLDARQALEQAGIASITSRQAKPFEHAWHALIEHRAIIATGSLAESTCNPGLADTERSSVMMLTLLCY